MGEQLALKLYPRDAVVGCTCAEKTEGWRPTSGGCCCVCARRLWCSSRCLAAAASFAFANAACDLQASKHISPAPPPKKKARSFWLNVSRWALASPPVFSFPSLCSGLPRHVTPACQDSARTLLLYRYACVRPLTKRNRRGRGEGGGPVRACSRCPRPNKTHTNSSWW